MFSQRRRRVHVCALGILFMSFGAAKSTSLRGRIKQILDTSDWSILAGAIDDASIASDFTDTTTPNPEDVYGRPVLLEPTDKSTQKKEEHGQNRIINGHNADPVRDGFYTMIMRAGGYYAGCGAALIGNCHALTAAHCVEGNRQHINVGIYAGAYQPYDGNPGVPRYYTEIESMEYHSDYDDPSNRHDMALIRFERCMTDAEMADIPPVRLADTSFSLTTGEMISVLGFGKLYEGQPSSQKYVDTLQRVSVPYIPYQTCNNMYGSRYTVYNDMICAGYPGGDYDACQGDSGGPAYVMRGNTPYLVGVVSWGVGCARPDRPGVYSSVMYHYDWIKTRVCSDPETDEDLALCGGHQRAFTSAPTPPPTPAPALSSGTGGEDRCDIDVFKVFKYTNGQGQVIAAACIFMTPGQFYEYLCDDYPEAWETCAFACDPTCR